jgi:hypothetical protein
MFIDAIHSKQFAIMFSFVLGLGLVVIFHPYCKNDECLIKKAPSVEEMKKSTYRLGRKCYQFRPESKECPANGVIESFC